MEFSNVLHGGTGEAAASLVGATLLARGADVRVKGRKVEFSVSQEEQAALKAFIDAVKDVVDTRQDFWRK